jgi:hypothetical protein
MADVCAHCNSADIQAGADEYFCLTCGGTTKIGGGALPRDPQFVVDNAPVAQVFSGWKKAQ